MMGDDARAADRRARATLTALIEPGDRVAGLVCEALGAAGLLEAIAGERTASELHERLFGRRVRGGVEGLPVPTPSATEDALLQRLGSGLRRWRQQHSALIPGATERIAERVGLRLIVPGDGEWPVGVERLGTAAPLALWARGTSLERTGPRLAIVGARAATNYGEHVTDILVAECVARGIEIISGAAYGIDGAAHRAALRGRGRTIAVLAGGAERASPAGHAQLITDIARSGAVISELAPGLRPNRPRFLQRNRVIAALSDAVIVVEAGWRSGSLNTAGHAAELGIPLGAVPGPITSTASRGCHRLIREYGATCLAAPEDAIELLPPESWTTLQTASPDDHRGRAGIPGTHGSTGSPVREALHHHRAATVAEIAEHAGVDDDEVRAELGRLELSGDAHRSGDRWRAGPRPR